MTSIEWCGSFSEQERSALELSLSPLGIDQDAVRFAMTCIGPSYNTLLVTSEELITLFLPKRRKHRLLEITVASRLQCGDLVQVAYKTRRTRDDDTEPRRLYALDRGGNVTQLGLLLLRGDLLERLAAVIDPLPLAIDGKLLEVRREGSTGPPSRALFAPLAVEVPVSVSVPPDQGTRKLFISYASEDQQAADAVAAELEIHGVSTWLANRDIDVGANYAEQIYNAIVNASHVIVLLSAHSVASVHVQREVNLALDQEKQLLPIVVSADVDLMEKLPAAWKYWLGVVQVVPYAGLSTAVPVLLRGLDESR